MLTAIIGFLVMLNPFALFLYLNPVMKELDAKQFDRVLFRASLISFIISFAFFLTGDFVFTYLFQIPFDSFRVFGGIVIFSFAYLFIVKGERALITIKTDLDDLAAEISLPYMVGAGTISLAVIMSERFAIIEGFFVLMLIFVINFVLILLLRTIRSHILRRQFRVAFDKNMELLLRLMGFFIGAIGINMIVVGLENIVHRFVTQ